MSAQACSTHHHLLWRLPLSSLSRCTSKQHVLARQPQHAMPSFVAQLIGVYIARIRKIVGKYMCGSPHSLYFPEMIK